MIIHPLYFSFSKENGGFEITDFKPPLGRCVLFWRIDNQPPKQRFFLFPLGSKKYVTNYVHAISFFDVSGFALNF